MIFRFLILIHGFQKWELQGNRKCLKSMILRPRQMGFVILRFNVFAVPEFKLGAFCNSWLLDLGCIKFMVLRHKTNPCLSICMRE